MEQETGKKIDGQPGDEGWLALDSFLGNLTEKVLLVVWGERAAGALDEEALALCQALAGRYEVLEWEHRPRQGAHPFHPIIGLMGIDEQGEEIDYRLRIIGLPAGYQINTLVGGIQAVSFKGQTLEALTRIQISRLQDELLLELFTTPEDEEGIHMAALLANLAVVNEKIRVNIVMVNLFPELITRYSIYTVPHTIINNRHHLQGVTSEEKFIKLVARAVKLTRPVEPD